MVAYIELHPLCVVCPPHAYHHSVEVNAVQGQSVGYIQEPPVTVAGCEALVLLVCLNHFSNEVLGLQQSGGLKGKGGEHS